MYKYMLLAASVLVSAPLLAQTVHTGAKAAATSPNTTTSSPVTSPQDVSPAPQTVDPSLPVAIGQPVPVASTPPAAAPSADQPPAPAAQVADIVNKEFPVYDKDGNGSLSKSEFSTWMLALKKTANPAARDDAANKSWTATAFAQADTDKSNSLSKDELIKFLSLGKKKA